MTDEFKKYKGYFTGSQQKNSGVKKDGTPWTSHDILFHHGDMTKPIRFTWFAPAVEFVATTIYNVLYVVDSFTKDGEARTAKKAIKVEQATDDTNLGYQQDTAPQPQTTINVSNTATPPPTTTAEVDPDNFLKSYKESILQGKQNKHHFVVSYLISTKPEVKPKLKALIDLYDASVTPVKEEQAEVVVEDV